MRIVIMFLDQMFYKQIEIIREDIRCILKSIKY